MTIYYPTVCTINHISLSKWGSVDVTCLGLAQLHNGSDQLREPSGEDVVAFQASRQRLYLEQVFHRHEFLMHSDLRTVSSDVCLSILLFIAEF